MKFLFLKEELIVWPVLFITRSLISRLLLEFVTRDKNSYNCLTINLTKYGYDTFNNHIIKLKHERDALNKQIKQHDTFNAIAWLW